MCVLERLVPHLMLQNPSWHTLHGMFALQAADQAKEAGAGDTQEQVPGLDSMHKEVNPFFHH